MERGGLPIDVGAGTAHAARAYNWYLGGKDNFEADRDLGRKTEQVWPTVRVFARENRLFMQRAVRYLSQREGIAQYLDIGSGIPTAPNVHEIAQQTIPASRVVYVDNDPMVISHARSLLRSDPEGKAAYLFSDIREPGKILEQAGEVLDFSKPVAILIIAVLHFVPDEWNPVAILGTLLDALPSGSFLVASHITEEFDPDTIGAAAAVYRKGTGMPAEARTREEFVEVAFTSQGLQIIDPGVQMVSEWRDTERPRPTPQQVSCYGAVARKP